MAQAGLGRRHEDSSATRAYPEMVLPERMNQARCWACSENFHEESHGVGPTPIMCRTPAASVKATRRIPAFPHEGKHLAPQGRSATLCGWSSMGRRRLKIARAASIAVFLRLLP